MIKSFFLKMIKPYFARIVHKKLGLSSATFIGLLFSLGTVH